MSNISSTIADQQQQKLDLLKDEFNKTLIIYQHAKNDYSNDINQLPNITNNLTINKKRDRLSGKMNDMADQMRRIQDMYQFETDNIKIQDMDAEMNDLVTSYTQANGDYISNITNYSPTKSGFTNYSSIIEGLDNNVAQTVHDKQQMISSLNGKLVDMAGTYLNQLTRVNTDTQTERTQKDMDHEKLAGIFGELLQDRAKINEMIDEYGSLDRQHGDNLVKTMQNETHFSVYFYLFVLFLFYLIKVIFLPDVKSNIFSVIFWISFFFYFIFTTFRLNEPAGFMLWGTMIIFFVLGKMGIIPTP